MSVLSIVIRHGRRWYLDMMILMRYIMTLSHYQRLPYGSHYLSSSSLISVSIVASALEKGFPSTFTPSSWDLESDVFSFPVYYI